MKIYKSEVLNLLNPIENIQNNENNSLNSEKLEESKKILKILLKNYKLEPIEAYKLLEIKPKTLLCVQLIIYNMEDRFSITELNDILQLFTN